MNEAAYGASLDQAVMTYRDMAILHHAYYKKLISLGMSKRTARLAMQVIVKVQFTHMFSCTRD
jgi:hypothetical protein